MAKLRSEKCLECDFECVFNYLGTHTKLKHGKSLKQYYDDHYHRDGDGECAECGAKTNFAGLDAGYNPTCSRICSARYRNKLLFSKYFLV